MIFLVVIFVLAALATFAYLQSSGKLGGLKVNLFSSIGTDEVLLEEETSLEEEELSIGVTEEETVVEEEEEPVEEDKVVISSEGKDYEIIAQDGEGITNLARRAVKQYLDGNSPQLTQEHKVFVEDYVQNHTGDKKLVIGEKVSFSEDLIVEAINNAQGLEDWELEHLENWSELVWTPGF